MHPTNPLRIGAPLVGSTGAMIDQMSAISESPNVLSESGVAGSSRDSLIKYLQLGDDQFELVIVYDGINDVRMNCCPREQFRDDYSHCSWYYEIQKLIDAGRMPANAGVADEFKLVHRLIFLTSS